MRNFIPEVVHGELGFWFWALTIPLVAIITFIIVKQEWRKGKK